jgi:hypothetical protein
MDNACIQNSSSWNGGSSTREEISATINRMQPQALRRPIAHGLVTTKQAATILNIRPATLVRYRYQGRKLPQPLKVNGVLLWRAHELYSYRQRTPRRRSRQDPPRDIIRRGPRKELSDDDVQRRLVDAKERVEHAERELKAARKAQTHVCFDIHHHSAGSYQQIGDVLDASAQAVRLAVREYVP